MMITRAFFILFMLAPIAVLGQTAPVAPPTLSVAGPVRVDDTGTTLSTPTTQLRWRSFGPGRERDNQVEASVRVSLRLNLTLWVGKKIRLFQRMANSADGGAFYVSWRGQGRLLPGTLTSGGRVLVYEGMVKDPFLFEALDVSISGDGRNLASFQALELFFEVDK